MSRSALVTAPGEWKRLRERWAARLPQPCSICGEPIERGHEWQLHATTPQMLGGTDDTVRPAHARCNIQHGNRMVRDLARLAADALKQNKNENEIEAKKYFESAIFSPPGSAAG